MKLKQLIFSLILTVSAQSFAVLGESKDTVQTDHEHMASKKQIKETTSSNYTVNEITGDMNTVKEYINSDGKIFAVSWIGAVHPDLENLLGSYYQKYRDAVQNYSNTKKKGRVAHLKLKNDDIIIEKSGHMGSVTGRAYIQSLLPSDFSTQDIQ